ncbi:MAG: hypothetical protein ACR2NL_08275, partial [Acidimicrobiia bacterium]
MNRTLRTLVVYGLSIIMLAVMANWFFSEVGSPEEVPLSQFIESVEEGRYEAVEILARSNEVQGSTDVAAAADGTWEQISSYPDGFEGELVTIIQTSGIPFTADPQPPGFWELLVSFLPWLFLLGFMVFIFMQMQGGGNRVMQFGKSKAKLVGKEQPKVTFDDVAGLVEAKEELE